MQKLRIILFLFSLAIPQVTSGTEDIGTLRSYWESIINKPFESPKMITVDLSLPGFREDPFCQEQEEDKNPNSFTHWDIPSGSEESYFDCLLESMENGHPRSPYEVSNLLRHDASSLAFCLNGKRIRPSKEPGQESPLNILENNRNQLKKLQEISRDNLCERARVLKKEKLNPHEEIYTDNPEELATIFKQKIKELRKLADDLVKVSAERGYCHAQNSVAWGLFDKGEFSQAQNLFELAAKKGLNVSQFGLGFVLEKKGEIEEADKHYMFAAQDWHPGALTKVALSKEREEKFEEAKLICALMYRDMRRSHTNLTLLGRLLEKESRYNEAEILYARAFTLEAVSRLKEMKKEGTLTRTQEWFTLASEDEGDAEYMLGLASDYQYEYHKEKMAIDYYTQAIQKCHPGAIVALGHIREAQEKFCNIMKFDEITKKAEDLYRQAHEKGYAPGTFYLAQYKATPTPDFHMLTEEERKARENEAQALFQIAKEKGYPIEDSEIDAIITSILG